MHEEIAELAESLTVALRNEADDGGRCERRLWEKWLDFQNLPALSLIPSVTDPPETIKVRLLSALSPNSLVLLNPTAVRLTRRIWQVLGGCSPTRISHRELVALVTSVFPAELLSSKLPEYYYGGLLLFDYLRPELGADHRLHYRVELGWASDETFRTQMFGFLSSIEGFNEVFGGALLVQQAPHFAGKEGEPCSADYQMQGRLVLVEGPFGIGKSVLTWRMAADFVLQGGLVFLHAPEQNVQESLYSLTAVDPSVDLSALVYSSSIEEFRKAPRIPGEGRLVLVNASDLELAQPDPAAGGLFSPLESLLRDTRDYSLRVCIVDPINAYIEEQSRRAGDASNQRLQTSKFIRAAKRAGVNLWITCETGHEGAATSHYFEHLADTTIRLGRPSTSDCASYPSFEIIKSRFQGQLPGRHHLLIHSGDGLRVFPSLESFKKLLPPPPPDPHRRLCASGVPGLALSIGKEGVKTGHVVVVTGPGKYKTVMGVHFLAGGWWPEEQAAGSSGTQPATSRLIISDMSVKQMEEIARGACGDAYPEFRKRGLDFLQVPSGWADAGEVLAAIRNELIQRKRQRRPVERVLLFTLSRLEETTPVLRDNELFGVTLMRLLRAYSVTTFVVNSDERRYGTSRLRDVVLEECDVRIDFDRKHYYQREQTVIMAVRTPASDHSRSFFCLNRNDDGRLQVEVSPFRILPEQDQLQPVPTKLYLLAETANHTRYHERVVRALQNFLNPTLEKRPRLEWEAELVTQASLTSTAGRLIDDVQVIQVDEFELPDPNTSQQPFFLFDREHNEELICRRHQVLQDRISTADGRRFFAVPYYFNCSFLALSRKDIRGLGANPFFEPDGTDGDPEQWNWKAITSYVEQIQEKRGLNSRDVNTETALRQLVFSCPVYDELLETYNSFFFEILQSMSNFSPGAGEHGFLAWVSSESAHNAAYCFRRLCRLSHRHFYKDERKPRALINRHWYNTLNQEVTNWHLRSNDDMSIRPMPGGLTTWGEWYLAVPSYSQSPDVALEVIRFLCSESQENARRYEGVGLPTLSDFYTRYADVPGQDQAAFSASPGCRLLLDDLKKMIAKGFRRSAIPGYSAVRSSISTHLRWLLELPDLNEASERQRIADILGSMCHEMRTIYAHGGAGARKAAM